jgi:peroxiredoxin
MSLQELIASLDPSLGVRGSEERLRAVEELIALEGERRPLKTGDQAPLFSLPKSNLGPISLPDLLRQGPLVVNFYRGLWCPYCQRDLIGLEQVLPNIKATNAAVLAISHQIKTSDGSQFLDEQKFSFPVLDDTTGITAEQFGIRWSADELDLIWKERGTDHPAIRETEPWIRPMQARYVINRDGIIAFAEVAFTYDQRTEPPGTLPVLAELN